MAIRVGINGFGRIGRNVFRAAMAEAGLEFVAVNDITDAKTLAHLLKYDSVHGPLAEYGRAPTRTVSRSGSRAVRVLAERDPAKLPWKDLGVDVVLECSGLFTDRDKAAKHLDGGRQEGDHLGARRGRRPHHLLRREPHRLRPGQAPRHLERVVHHQLPRAGRQGAARDASASSAA